MVWIEFLGSAVIVVLAAIQLTKYGDAIAVRTRLGGMFVGTLLLAGATSLPELLAAINSLRSDLPNLAIGNMFGSNMFNMFLLAVVDLLAGPARALRRVAMRHAFTAGMGMLLALMAVFFIQDNIDWHIGWVGVDSLLLMGAYILGVGLLRSNALGGGVEAEENLEGVPRLRHALIGFFVASAVLVVTMPWMVESSAGIAEATGLTTGFVGTTLVAMATSLPELTACIAAVRIGAYDMAVGNLFGSNMFNMFAVGFADIFFTKGRFLEFIDPAFMMAAMLATILGCLGLLGNVGTVRRRLRIIEIDALLIMIVYFGGLWLLYSRGVGL